MKNKDELYMPISTDKDSTKNLATAINNPELIGHEYLPELKVPQLKVKAIKSKIFKAIFQKDILDTSNK